MYFLKYWFRIIINQKELWTAALNLNILWEYFTKKYVIYSFLINNLTIWSG